VARVWIKPGAGKITVNGKDQDAVFRPPGAADDPAPAVPGGRRTDQFDVMAPSRAAASRARPARCARHLEGADPLRAGPAPGAEERRLPHPRLPRGRSARSTAAPRPAAASSSRSAVGIIDEPLTFILYNVNAVIITLAHAFAPFAILPIFVALEKIDRSLLEAGLDLGESKFTTFLRVTLPLSMPGVVAAVLIVFIPTIGDYVTPEQMGGAGGKLIANMIQTQFFALNNAPLGAAIALVSMTMVTLVALVFVFLNRRWLRGRR
jgi:ABC-type proline/glycine betaine transport system permease subunit